ncbi:hypothetical protein GCM10009001_01390 [Virgibacillus siamensis]|uniref:Uncharacterized protein n=1 Tax=Virgibacillus siamensis TaxID=480071 RepID=A0ABP3QLG3_9BACI
MFLYMNWVITLGALFITKDEVAKVYIGDLTDSNKETFRINRINNSFNLDSTKGYAGVNIDFEGILNEDRDVFLTFLSNLQDWLSPGDFYLL